MEPLTCVVFDGGGKQEGSRDLLAVRVRAAGLTDITAVSQVRKRPRRAANVQRSKLPQRVDLSKDTEV